jgi:heat shock protein HslJ
MKHSHGSLVAGLLFTALIMACQPGPGDTADRASAKADSATPDSAPLVVEEDSGLTSGEWSLVALAGQAAPLGAGDRPATIVFTPGTNRVAGFSGCNRAAGSYEMDGNRLTFGPMIMTRMACDKGMELEQRYATTMDSTRSYRLTADTLELMDAANTVIARFERRPN